MPKVAQHKFSGIIYNGWLGVELLFNSEENVICPLPLILVLAALLSLDITFDMFMLLLLQPS